MGLIESIRKWIDGEQGEDLLEAADEHSKPRRIWEEFLVKIAREVEAVMQREMFTPHHGFNLARDLHQEFFPDAAWFGMFVGSFKQVLALLAVDPFSY